MPLVSLIFLILSYPKQFDTTKLIATNYEVRINTLKNCTKSYCSIRSCPTVCDPTFTDLWDGCTTRMIRSGTK